MVSQSKDEQLNIRASSLQKMKLAEAAKRKSMNVSQFILSTSLEAAEGILADQRIIQLSGDEYDRFFAKLEEPAVEIPQLRELFSKKSILE